jgi:hypothetical protein
MSIPVIVRTCVPTWDLEKYDHLMAQKIMFRKSGLAFANTLRYTAGGGKEERNIFYSFFSHVLSFIETCFEDKL